MKKVFTNSKRWQYGLLVFLLILGFGGGFVILLTTAGYSRKPNPYTVQVTPQAGLRDTSIIESNKSNSVLLPSSNSTILSPEQMLTPGSSLVAGPLLNPVFEETASLVRLKTASFQLEITKNPWRMNLNGPNGQPIWRQANTGANSNEKNLYGALAFLVDKTQLPTSKKALYSGNESRQWFHLTTVSSVQWVNPILHLEVTTDDPSSRRAIVTLKLDPTGLMLLNLELSSTEGVVSVAASSEVSSDEHFYGLGQRQVSSDQRGRIMFNLVRGRLTLSEGKGEGSYAPFPFVLSSKGYGLLANTLWPNSFDMAAKLPDASLIVVEAANLNLAFFVDENPLKILQNLSALIGRPPLPPPWTFGVWKTSIGGQTAVLAEASRLQAEQIPVSALFIYDTVDPHSGTGWDTQIFKPIPPGTYPDIALLNKTLHASGYKTLAYTDDGVLKELPLYQEGVQNKYFILNRQGQPYQQPMSNKEGSLIDFTNPAAFKWYQASLKRILVELGFDGAMQDQGDLLPRDAVLSNGKSGYEMASSYALLYGKAAYEAIAQSKPEAVFFMRSGYLGLQQYQKATWTGDLEGSWDSRKGLPSAVTAALSRSIGGSPFIGSEIAGYQHVAMPFVERRELYLRWTQFAAFTPIMRDNLGPQPREEAVYLWTDAQTIANFKKYARLHTDLFPLFYTLAKEASETGRPIMRHPFLLYPTDPKAAIQEYEYFLGDSLLVAPVVNLKEIEKTVYLPQGEWVDFWSGQLFKGEQQLKVAAPLDTIPLFVRAGAIIPTLLKSPLSLAVGNDPLANGLKLKVYNHSNQSQTTKLVLYDDTTVTYVKEANTTRLKVGGSVARIYQIELPANSPPLSLKAKGSTDFENFNQANQNKSASWHYDVTKQQLVVQVTGKEFELSFLF